MKALWRLYGGSITALMAKREMKHAEKKEKWQRKMKHACLSSASEALMYNVINVIKII
jgi:hypothetical protein